MKWEEGYLLCLLQNPLPALHCLKNIKKGGFKPPLMGTKSFKVN